MEWLGVIKEFLISWDHWLFLQINTAWTNSFCDVFFPYVTDLFKQPSFKFFIFPVGLGYAIYRGRWRTGRVVIAALILFAISDNITHRVYKPTFERKRPEFVLKDKVQLRTHSHSGHSFPSNHATNSFTLFLFLSFFLPYSWIYWIFAGLVAYSRVYVGVHFPIDVTVGAISGTLIAYLGYTIFRKIEGSALERNSGHS